MAPRDFPAGGWTSDYLAFWAVWIGIGVVTFAFLRRSRAKSSRARLVAGNALVLALLLWTAVLGAESYLRYVYDATDSYGLTLTNYSWFGRHVQVNSQGFRDREFDAGGTSGVTRVACVGDSFTFAYGVADPANAWPQRLGVALAARGDARFDVRNHGVVGLDTGAEVELVERLVRDGAADRVILGYCLNDADDLLPPALRFDRGTAPRLPWIEPTRSFLADFLWFRLRLRDDPRVGGYFDWVEVAYADPVVLRQQTERFRRMAEACRTASVPLDVVVFPLFHAWGADYRFDACHDRVAAAWKSAGIDVIDLRDAYRGIAGENLVVNRCDAHPNARAHDIAARAVFDRAFSVR